MLKAQPGGNAKGKAKGKDKNAATTKKPTSKFDSGWEVMEVSKKLSGYHQVWYDKRPCERDKEAHVSLASFGRGVKWGHLCVGRYLNV